MERRNIIFSCVFDWLCQNKGVKGQKDLSDRTGISENTLTNILKGKTSVSDQTLHKLNAGFGYIFNMQYLRGIDPYHMLISDVVEDSANVAPFFGRKMQEISEKEKESIKEINKIDTKVLMSGLENLLQIASTQIKENEELRRELKASILENQKLYKKMQTSIKELNDAVCTLLSKPYHEVQQEYLKAAEDEEKYK